MIQALLDLYECTFDQKYLIWADELQTVQDQLFWDHGYAGYFSTSSSNEHNIFRFKDGKKILLKLKSVRVLFLVSKFFFNL